MRINITPYSERKRWIDGERERGGRCKRVNSCCSVVALGFSAVADERNSHKFMLVFYCFILFSFFLLLFGLSSASGEMMQVTPVNVTALHLTLNKRA